MTLVLIEKGLVLEGFLRPKIEDKEVPGSVYIYSVYIDCCHYTCSFSIFVHQTTLSFYHLPRRLGPKNSVKPTTSLNDSQQSSPFPFRITRTPALKKSFPFQGLIEKKTYFGGDQRMQTCVPSRETNMFRTWKWLFERLLSFWGPTSCSGVPPCFSLSGRVATKCRTPRMIRLVLGGSSQWM